MTCDTRKLTGTGRVGVGTGPVGRGSGGTADGIAVGLGDAVAMARCAGVGLIVAVAVITCLAPMISGSDASPVLPAASVVIAVSVYARPG